MIFNINNVDDLVTEAYINVCQAVENNNDLKKILMKNKLLHILKKLSKIF